MGEAWNNLGNAYVELARLDEAEAAYVEATRTESPGYEPWFNLGNVRADLGDTAGAVQAYQRALAIDPEAWRAGRRRGRPPGLPWRRGRTRG